MTNETPDELEGRRIDTTEDGHGPLPYLSDEKHGNIRPTGEYGQPCTDCGDPSYRVFITTRGRNETFDYCPDCRNEMERRD